MSAVNGCNPVQAPHPPRTTLAFLLSPGIAACAGPLLFCFADGRGPGNWDIIPFMIFLFAVVGYGTAFVLAVPVYLLLPERLRRRFFIAVPAAGAIAAAPWFLLPIAVNPTHPDVSMASFAFGLGCVAGAAFTIIRGAWRESS